jgi:hypothetical protein
MVFSIVGGLGAGWSDVVEGVLVVRSTMILLSLARPWYHFAQGS